jgi:hypothetical protein
MAEHALARRALHDARDALVRSEGKLARVREKAAETVERVVQTAEVAGGAFVLGLLNGRYTKMTASGPRGPEVVGIPAELAAGLGLHVLGFSKLAKNQSHHLHNVGDGALAAYFTQLGRGTGIGMIPTTSPTSALPGASPAGAAAATAGYSDAEIAAMAARTLR